MSNNPNPGFVPESWSLYGVGMFLVSIRILGRIQRVGITKLQYDDYFILFGAGWYTMLCVAFNQMLEGAGSNLMTPEETAALTPEIKEQRVTGSKWVFVSEHAMLLTIWSMKAAMLVLYARIIDRSTQRKFLYALIVWIVVAFVGDELALFTICRPVQQYWAVPASNVQCSTYQYYQIVNAVFNISTDILLLAVGIPPILKARLTLQQKAALGVIFGMGSFVIIAAIMRAIYCLVPSLISYVYMNWYFREATVAVYVTTLPGIWVLLRDAFPKALQKLSSKHDTRKDTYGNGYGNNFGGHYGKSTGQKDYGQLSANNWRVQPKPKPKHSRGDSKEFDLDLDTMPINGGKAGVSTAEVELGHSHGDGSSTSSGRFHEGEIRRDVTYTVEHEPMQKG